MKKPTDFVNRKEKQLKLVPKPTLAEVLSGRNPGEPPALPPLTKEQTEAASAVASADAMRLRERLSAFAEMRQAEADAKAAQDRALLERYYRTHR